jgi:PfaB family protein
MNSTAPIAVVGAAGVFPGASNLNLFWQNILDKVDASREVPPNRWVVAPSLMVAPELQPDKAISKRCALIEDFEFRPDGFDLNLDLAALDPLYHLILHVGQHALTGDLDKSINRKRTGVILAAIALPTDTTSRITANIFGRVVEKELFQNSALETSCERIQSYSRGQYFASRATGLPAAILARAFGLGGGTYTLDAACASALYALKLACDELHAHRADAMLAGGVSRPDCLFTQVGFSQLKALSPSGRCAPFDDRADGLVVGEGAGLVVLKRIEDALRDQNPIWGLIHGIGLSNDVRGNLLAPDSEGQLRAMRSAYQSCGWSPCDIDLIECHGAGTPLGDLTELESLKKLWGESGWTKGQCAIGSLKSMIGHLLTAAGAAGVIKILLALQHRILPPSLNFHNAPPNSPLHAGPFRIQTEPEEWHRRNKDHSRRAAISAFGFGGINAHLLLEEWNEDAGFGQRNAQNSLRSAAARDSSGPKFEIADRSSEIAIVGMAAEFGSIAGLRDFQELIFKGGTNLTKRSAHRWKAADEVAAEIAKAVLPEGSFMDAFPIAVGEFHIPPKEIPDILPQQLLMLKVAAKAMLDAGLPLQDQRPRMGAIIGIDFDFEAANFHLRWSLENCIPDWLNRFGLDPDQAKTKAWVQALKNSCSPPLTASRTLGALGSMVASRVAREFQFGGPSFTVSCEAASGLKALAIGMSALQRQEADGFLIAAVDLCGDIRNIVLQAAVRPFAQNGKIHPFDRSADGTLPGEGAAALVIKRRDQAVADGDRIYALIKGLGNASGGGIDTDSVSIEAYQRSLADCCRSAHVEPATISLLEAHGSGIPGEDNLESEALQQFFEKRTDPCALASVKANIGHSGAVSALASLIKTSLCLYHEIIPPLVNFTRPTNSNWSEKKFHFPRFSHYWTRNREDGPRRAMIAAMTSDGNCMHVILEGNDTYFAEDKRSGVYESVHRERNRPLGFQHFGIFVVESDSKARLLEGLDRLQRHLIKYSDKPLAARLPAPAHCIEHAAHTWFIQNDNHPERKLAVSIAADNFSKLKQCIHTAKKAVLEDRTSRIENLAGVGYSPTPKERTAELAFVFPGSGNHYLGMGRGLSVHWPEILRQMDAQTRQLKTQLVPQCYVPWRVSWEPGWQKQAYDNIVADPLHMIFGPVVHSGLVANLMAHFAIRPSAVIGYSLGESAGYFAMGVWPERGEMLQRMRKTDLFSHQLAGPCAALRNAWNVPAHAEVNWCVAVVNRPADAVRRVISRYPATRLLIINTPGESVIGGRREELMHAIKELDGEAIFLDGVATVHCDAVKPVAEAYRNLHIFQTRPPEGIRFYSCAFGRAYAVTSAAAANSILDQALHGFNFAATIRQAYRDGVRVFLEMGPSSSCTRMIDVILKDNPHTALSACVRAEDDYITIVKVLGNLIAERVPVDLSRLYGGQAYAPAMLEPVAESSDRQMTVMIGGKSICPALPSFESSRPKPDGGGQTAEDINLKPANIDHEPGSSSVVAELIETANRIAKSTADAHQKFLALSEEISRSYAETFNLQTRLLERALETAEDVTSAPDTKIAASGSDDSDASTSQLPIPDPHIPHPVPAFSREACLQFARGSVAEVLGAEFAVVDTYRVRVRLPDEPLMLVDRILSVEGQKGSLRSGRIITEHDVRPDAWYLDGGHAPVCISVEAGQADLFLCAYLGIDLKVQGRRTYRLLDATVKFHRELPRPGETVRYEIEIEKFIRQGDTYLFLFHFKGFIGNTPLITMTNGCAGFFTEEEVKNSGGIILTEADRQPVAGKKPADWQEFVPLYQTSYDDTSVQALRTGNLSECFGDAFKGLTLPTDLRLPDGRMKLIDRVVNLDPCGGRFGLGLIQSAADIHPEAWFLTCHFVDDMVMPGTLMYECCAHTLRVFLQRIGWVTEKSGVFYEPVRGIEATLKCRGPVTPETKRVTYEVEIKEMGCRPEPYVIADAYVYADGDRIVFFRDMSVQLSNITREEIESGWQARRARPTAESTRFSKPVLFGRSHLLEFAAGQPSRAFGNPYEPFDRQRFIARLPQPPYLLIDRIVKVEPEPWVLKPDGWIEAECDVDPDAWYFRAERTAAAPISIFLEIALQPCGWLAAYMGSALRSAKDLRFRNLGGHATLYGEILPDSKTLTIRCRLTQVSEAADMIIEHFDFEIQHQDRKLYAGSTYFGFFTAEALARQQGVRDAATPAYRPSREQVQAIRTHVFSNHAPLWPEDANLDPAPALAMPSKALRMIDQIDTYLPEGGPAGLGFVRGSKTVEPQEWFFNAHFYQDPVCPGSLGIESFIQLLKFMACNRWPDLLDSHRFALLTGQPHRWIYRGQIIPKNRTVTVEAAVASIGERPCPSIVANGHLQVDGLTIYRMENFGIRIIPVIR